MLVSSILNPDKKLRTVVKDVLDYRGIIINPDDNMTGLKETLQEDFKKFYRFFWSCISGDTYIDNWHVDMLCDVMTAVYKRQLKKVVINIPPRCSKTGICTIAFPAWVWANNPSLKFIYGSQDLSVALEFSRQCRELIEHHDYIKLFNVHLRRDASGKKLFVNTEFGHRLTVSVNSSITGSGADFILGDDINDVNKVESEPMRAQTIRWLANSSATRVQSKETATVVIQQRTHPFDGSGYLLALDDPSIVSVCLPMEFDETRRCVFSIGNTQYADPRRKHGELLWPERFDRGFTEGIKRYIGAYNYGTQYQQFPAPEEGGIFKKEHWSWYPIKGSKNIEYIMQSWDTALTDTAGSCYSCCVTFGIFEDENGKYKAILLNMWKGRVEYPELRHLAQRMYMNYKDTNVNFNSSIEPHHMQANRVVIEEKVSGYCLAADLRKAGLNVQSFNPNHYGKKMIRARIASGLIQGKAFLLPCKEIQEDGVVVPYPFADQLVNDCAMYTGADGESNDVVDALSQGLIYMDEIGWIYNNNNPDFKKKIDVNNLR